MGPSYRSSLLYETAHETGHWPEYAQLSQGDAAKFQLAAEDLARELGLEDLYRQVLAGAENIITILTRRIDPKTMRLICACGRTGRRGRRILRRDCWGLGLECLPVLERQRRDELKSFWPSAQARPVAERCVHAPCAAPVDLVGIDDLD